MQHFMAVWGWWLRCFSYLVAGALLAICFVGVVMVNAQVNNQDIGNWSSPAAMTIRRVSPVSSSQSEPNFFNNLDCSLVTYRTPASSEMRTGCFTETAFGMMDSDSGIVIFNGTDEGVPLLAYSPGQVLAPWPHAGGLLQLEAVPTGGSRINLYKNPSATLQDQRNGLLQLTAKQLAVPADLLLKNAAGQPLVINSQTLAFSDSGSWLVAETLGGSFVRINLATLDVKAFAPSFGSQGSPGALLKSRVAISDDGRFAAIANQAAGTFKVYDLMSCASDVCPSYDYRSFAASQINGLQSIRHLRFINSGLLSFEATADNPAVGGIYELAPTASITSLIDYLGLGDSYASGEGAFDYLAGTDDEVSNCHLSVNSYPLLLARDLFSSRGGHSAACSGAKVNDLVNNRSDYKGQVKNSLSFQDLQQNQPALLNSVMTNFLPGYVAQQRFVGQYQPAAITVMAGGNDIGFGDILQQCVTPSLSNNDCFNSYEDRQELLSLIDRTKPRLVSLYRQLESKAPGGRLYVIGYPQVTDNSGNCALNVQLSKNEMVFAEGLIDYLNGTINKAANEAGVVYVDISQALAGHKLCETASHNVAINGLTAGKDSGPFGFGVIGRESYHPNALGHELIEQSILRQTANLTKFVPVAGNPPASQALLQASKTGRAIAARVPVPDLTSGVILAGKTMPVKANGPEAGLKANTLYNIKLDGPGGTVIGALQSDASGNIETSVIIPAITPPGGHTIDIIGPGQTGGTLDVTQPVYVPQNQDDADGDGAFNGNDSCPIIRNSGQDTDKDGVDDVCDGLIGLPPANPTSGSSGSISGSSATKQTPSSSFKNSPGPAKSSSSKLAKSPNLTPRLAKTTLQNNYRSERRFFWLILVFVGICLLILGRLRDSNEQPAYA